MQQLLVEGGARLSGCVCAHAAKNAALPIMAASLLCHGSVTLLHLPDLTDLHAMAAVLEQVGARIHQEADGLCIETDHIEKTVVSENLTGRLRASNLLLGPVLARAGNVALGASGGCAIGARPIDLHLFGLKKLGACRADAPGCLTALSAPKGLRGCEIHLPFPSVGATENILTAAVTAKGTTRIYGGAAEPEVLDLAHFLNCCGGRIFADGAGFYEIGGVGRLHGCVYTPMQDRIETATYLAAAAASGGEILVEQAAVSALPGVLDDLAAMGCRILQGTSSVGLIAPERLQAVAHLKTAPYPGFPTDLQAVFMTLSALAKGETQMEERMFEQRFPHISCLRKMGACIQTDGSSARIFGRRHLHGAELQIPDLRAGGALLIAALAAKGRSVLTSIEKIDRGYERLDLCLASLGGRVKRTERANGNEKITANDPSGI